MVPKVLEDSHSINGSKLNESVVDEEEDEEEDDPNNPFRVSR